MKVTKGKDKTFTITPLSPCYEIEDVLVDGVSEGAIDTYTFTNIQANHTIEVIFVSPVSKATNIDSGLDYCSIQSAIDAPETEDGHTIIVCPGTYYENITIAKNITLQSVDPFDWDIVADTIIDGSDDDTVITFTAGGYEPVLRGFTITNGYQYEGGGISMEDSSPTIEYNIITENHSDDYGGGIYMYDNCNPYIRHNKIIKNLADDVGGGIYMTYECNPTIKYNYIEENEVEDGDGGGIYMENDSGYDTIIANISYNYIRYNDANDGGGIVIYGNCNPTIESNLITDNKSSGRGGGISVDDDSEPIIRDNDISDNKVIGMSGKGGGISVYGSSPLIENNTISGNVAHLHGGGISIEFATTEETTPTVIDNTFNDNEAEDGYGGGIYLSDNSNLLPEDDRPAGWGTTRENIPPYNDLPIAGNTFSGNSHNGSSVDNGAHVYFAE